MSELEELKQKIEEYEHQLIELKTSLLQESEDLKNKSKGDKKLSLYDRERKAYIPNILKEIEDQLEKIKRFNNINILKSNLFTLAKPDSSSEEKDKALKLLTKHLGDYKSNAQKDWESIMDEFGDKSDDLKACLEDLQKDIQKLHENIEIDKRFHVSTELHETKLAEKIRKYNIIKAFLVGQQINVDDLNFLAKVDGKSGKKDNKEKKKTNKKSIFQFFKSKKEAKENNTEPVEPVAEKETIYKKCDKTIDDVKKEYGNEILNNKIDFDEEKRKQKESFKKSLKAVSNKLTEVIKKHPVHFIAGTSLTLVILASILSSNSKKVESNIDNTLLKPNPTPGYETSIDKDTLADLGYNENYAEIVFEDFSDETLEQLDTDHLDIEEIKTYANIPEFKLDYLKDYENAINVYGITPSDAVDYVNRAYKLQEVNFFVDSKINDVVEVLREIDKHEEESNYMNLIDEPLSQVKTNYLFGTITPRDIAILDNLENLVQKDSDEYKFIVQYVDLLKAVIANPTSEEALNKLQLCIRIFAENLYNAQYNEPSHLSDDIEFNDNAIVTNKDSWIFIRKNIIDITYEIAFPYDYEDERFREGEELALLMDSAMNNIQRNCESKLSLMRSKLSTVLGGKK